jgi:hypothetical protein
MYSKQLKLNLYDKKSKVTTRRMGIAFFSMLLLPLTTIAQKEVMHQTQLWYAYFNNLKFSDKYRLLTDVQERQFIKPVGAQGNLIFRSILYRSLGNNWEAGAGLALFFTSPQKIPSSIDLVVPELRPTIDFTYKQKAGNLNISHRYRFEARYFHDVENNKLSGGYIFGTFRCRYQFSADYPIIKNAQKKPVLSIRAYDEIFVNFGGKIVSNTFDQNRIYGGLMYDVNKSLTLELGYLNWFQETTDGTTYYNRNIIRFGINHRINLSKSKGTK